MRVWKKKTLKQPKSREKKKKNERLVMIYVAIFTIVAFALFVGWAGNEVIKI